MIARIVAVAWAAVLAASTPNVGAQRPGGASRAGWLGISLAQHNEERPVIVSVEPGSPAQRAGLVAGDTVLDINNVDMLKESYERVLPRMLRPGNRIVMRVSRDKVRQIPVVVEARPKDLADVLDQIVTGTDIEMALTGTQKSLKSLLQPSFTFEIPGCADTPVAGAAVVSITPELADALHMTVSGVLVTIVAPGTPAMTAGLKSGDVIVAADTVRVTSPATLTQLIHAKSVRTATGAAGRTVVLKVRRRGQARTIKLRW